MLTYQEVSRIVSSGIAFKPFDVANEATLAEQLLEGRARPDFVFSISWEGQTRRFLVESKPALGLASLQGAIGQAKAMAYSNPSYLPMVLLPYLRREALDALVDAQVSGLDLCGNGVIYVPGLWFAHRTGAPNQYSDSSPIVSPFRGNQSIVARAFLRKPEFSNQKEIVEYLRESGIAPSTVSKMLVALEENLLISRKPIIRVVRPDALLDRLREDYTPFTRRRVEKVRLVDGESAWKRINDNTAGKEVQYVISDPQRYTVLPSNTSTRRIITNNADALLSGIAYTLDERFPTLELIETDSRTPFFDKRDTNGYSFTSPIQEYLELANGSKREADAANVIRNQILQQNSLI